MWPLCRCVWASWACVQTAPFWFIRSRLCVCTSTCLCVCSSVCSCCPSRLLTACAVAFDVASLSLRMGQLGVCADSTILVHQVSPLRLYIDLFVCVFFCLFVLPFAPAHCLCCSFRFDLSVAAYGPAGRVCRQHHSGSSGLAFAFVHRLVCVCVLLSVRAALRACSLPVL